ncbi:PREDICTED: nuclear pore complex protein NUP205-like isoform X7 [Lupinus angustifolius]|uniref:nuclear pore complex protein NUP205-like isoform X7 n=1 Tax=Lupinus angustifolius TaxID=3871 RepID=UPI00092E723F|nr:PREDICTED: nuclear pore complex protein NUP205-like isoform X7 [Lupinus angustifolius]
MVSPKQLLSTLESTLLGPSPPTAAQRVELLHAIRTSSSSFQSLLSYSTPKSSDRNQVQSKSVRLPDSSPITLDDQDVQIALKLSDDLHLNEVDCVRLLVSANQEWGLMGRGPLEILRLAAGLWYTERRDLITSLHLLLRAVVLDQGLEDEILVDIQKYLEHLINSGLRQRLISLIKELNREDSSGLGGPQCEPYILDSRGSLVERRAVVSRERLIIGHCLVLSVLVVRTSPKDVKDIFSVLKDCASEVSVSNTTVKHQITFSLLFALVVAFVSDGLSTVPDKASILSSDASFRREFHELVMATGNDPVVEGFIGGIRLAWVVHLMLIQDGVAVRETVLSGSSNEMGYLSQCLDVIFSTNSFQFLLDKILHTASYQNEDEDMIYMYNAYLHKLITCFLSNSFARDKIKESKERTMSVLSPYRVVGSHDFAQDRNSSSQHGSDMGALTFNSILDFVSEIYQKEPELLSGNDVLWTFVNFAGEDHTTFQTLVTFLNMLSTLASSQEGASKVYELLQGKAFRSIGWSTLFECLTIYDDKFKQSLQTAGAMLPDIQEGDAKALVAYLNVLKKVVENGNPIERKNWFPDIEPLFKLLSYENVPPYLKLLIDNISRPAPNITHLLLKFDLDVPVERTVLQPKFYYSCMKVILDILENLLKPDVNALLHEFGFQLLYELCIDPLTCEPTMDLLSNKKYHFFIKHLDTICSATLPKRNSNQPLRISSLHQRAWLLKLLAVELHAGDVSSSTHREACQTVLSHLFGQDMLEIGGGQAMSPFSLQATYENAAIRTVSKSKVLELLEIIQFRCPDTSSNLSNIVAGMKYDLLVEDILGNPGNSGKGGVYYYSERNDRLIDLASFHDKLWQKYTSTYLQVSNLGSEVELNDVRETIQQLLRWGWKYNKNLEEQAAQLHMVTAWSQIVEVSASRRLALLEDRSEILFQVLDASLSACASPDCSLKMAFILSQVALTCMAKLRDERFLFPGSLSSDNITCLDLIVVKQLSNGACLTILFKLIMAILRNESSEALRRRQYALLLSYFQYCQNVVDPDVPTTVLQFLLLSEQDNDYIDLPKIDKEQAELARANFSTLRKEAQSILDLVIKDATHGSEPGKTISLYVLDALICIDHERYFLNQLQSRGFLRSCFTAISSVSNQDGGLSLDSLQRACTFEAELALLLRISHKYEKSGAQVLFSMGILEHLSSGRIISSQGGLRRVETRLRRDMATDIDRQRMIVTPILRLVFSLTSLVDTSEFLEMKNKIVREIIDFVKGHQPLLDHILRVDIAEADDLRMEQINLVVGILSKIWPYEQSSEYGFVQGLFGMMHALFSRDLKVSSFAQSISPKNQRNSELQMFKLCFSLSSYLYFLVTKKSLRLQYSDATSSYPTSVEIQQPTLSLLNSLLTSVTTALERASEEKSLLLNKIRDINELSRQEVDEIINMCVQQDYVPSSDNIHKRRYIAMVEMCQVVASWDQQIILLLPLSEHVLNIILIHLQESCVASDSTLTTKTITYGAKYNPEQDIAFLCGKLVPALERLELLSEDKIGRNLKVFNRLVTSAKDVAIQKLVL